MNSLAAAERRHRNHLLLRKRRSAALTGAALGSCRIWAADCRSALAVIVIGRSQFGEKVIGSHSADS